MSRKIEGEAMTLQDEIDAINDNFSLVKFVREHVSYKMLMSPGFATCKGNNLGCLRDDKSTQIKSKLKYKLSCGCANMEHSYCMLIAMVKGNFSFNDDKCPNQKCPLRDKYGQKYRLKAEDFKNFVVSAMNDPIMKFYFKSEKVPIDQRHQ
jgi:hypothetical protein